MSVVWRHACAALANAFAETAEFLFSRFEVVEEADDVTEGAQAGMFVIAEVGDVSQPGDAGLVEVDFSGASFETVDEVAAEEFLDHFGVEAAEIRGFGEIGEEGAGGFTDTGELVVVGHGGNGLG